MGSSLCRLILRNCKANVCFGEINVYPSALLSKISREDVRSWQPDFEADLLIDPRASISIATLSTSLLGTSGMVGVESLLPL